MRCPECGGIIIYAPDNSIIAPIDPNHKTGKNEPFGCGDIVCTRCGLVLDRWHLGPDGQVEEDDEV